MRFFTHDWSTLDDVETDKISSEHLRVVKLASDQCGIPLVKFVREFDLRGALVDRLLVQSGEAELKLDLCSLLRMRAAHFAILARTSARL